MSDRPILFNGSMVRAILDGRKTMFREVLKPQPNPGQGAEIMPTRDAWRITSKMDAQLSLEPLRWRPGDQLWVRETWRPGAWRDDGRVACDYRASPEITNTPWCYPDNSNELWIRLTAELIATGSVPDADGIHHWEAGQCPLRWRSSIHMPRWASRITLAVKAVRIERLLDISEADAVAEGIIPGHATDWMGNGGQRRDITPRDAYAALWNTIHGPGAWDANPWVAVIEFIRVPQPHAPS